MAEPTLGTCPQDVDSPEVMVFAGSSEVDVCYARIFWNSVTLQPPLESRLVSGDIRQRLRAAPPPAPQIIVAPQISPFDQKIEQIRLETQKALKAEEKAYYLEKAKQREEIIALLKTQREERLKKEQVSFNHKPKTIALNQRPTCTISEIEDMEAVKALPPLD
ncbi:cilia- and flagella-associated protein HOATZ isoform X1 [Lissotriton helveticus]